MVAEELEPADGDERVVEAGEQPDRLVVDAQVERERGEALLADPAEHDEHDAPAHDHGAEHPAHRIAPPERVGPRPRCPVRRPQFLGDRPRRGRGSRSRLRSCQGRGRVRCHAGPNAGTGAPVDWEPPWDSSTRSCTPARAASSSRWSRSRPSRRRVRARDGGAAPTTSCARSRAAGARSSTSVDDPDKQQEHLDDLLPEAFAAVREAGKRTLGQRHFDVQIMGGAALHFGWVAEMKTGEGKTLVATLPALPQRARRRRRAPRHRQRLPGQARRRVDGPDLPVPRARGRHGHPRDRRLRGEAARVRRRHHLRHQQRVRLRLPARQHGRSPATTRCSAATPSPSSTRSTRSSSTRPARR